jgi:hypothetical protein
MPQGPRFRPFDDGYSSLHYFKERKELSGRGLSTLLPFPPRVIGKGLNHSSTASFALREAYPIRSDVRVLPRRREFSSILGPPLRQAREAQDVAVLQGR